MLILNCFSALLSCSILGFIIALIVHISVIGGFYIPSKTLIMTLNIGFLILLFSREFISKRIKKGVKTKDFVKSVFVSCPKLIKIIAAIFIVYGICVSIISLIGAFHLAFSSQASDTTENIEIMRRRFYIGLSALWILIYAYECATSFTYRKLWKKRIYKNIHSLGIENINIEL